MKTKTINLETWERMHPIEFQKMQRIWRVKRVTDSLEFNPGQELERDAVEALTRNASWKVFIVELGK